MAEKQDGRLHIERGSRDCRPISVSICSIRSRTQLGDRHLVPKNAQDSSCYVSDVQSLAAGSDDALKPAKESRLLENRNLNGLNRFVLSGEGSSFSKDGGKAVALPHANCHCGSISRQITEESTSIRETRRKCRFFHLTPKPFVVGRPERDFASVQPIVSNTNGCGAVCRTNSGSYIGVGKDYAHFKNCPTVIISLINNKTSSVTRTSVASDSLYEDAACTEPSISAVDKEKVGTNDRVVTEGDKTAIAVVNQNVSHTRQALTGVLRPLTLTDSVGTEGKNFEALKPSEVHSSVTSANCWRPTQPSRFESLVNQDDERCTAVRTLPADMGNTPPRSQRGENFGEWEKSKQPASAPATCRKASLDRGEDQSRTEARTIPELTISDSGMEQQLSALSVKESDFRELTSVQRSEAVETGESEEAEKMNLRPHENCDSAYSSDSRCTSMDSHSCPGGRVEDVDLCDQDSHSVSLLSPPTISLDINSASLSSSLSSSPLPTPAGNFHTSGDSLRVVSAYGLQRNLSSSSGSSFRSSLSFEESEDDALSSDGETRDAVAKVRRRSKALSSWRKIKRVVVWAPFMQSFKKKYPWVQLAGHAGNFQPSGEEGYILKKYCEREAECLDRLSKDVHLKPYAPDYHGVVDKDGERYTRMEDLLLAFDCPSVMDCKMGVRTYLEDELVKAKIKPRLRHDMYAKMTEISPDEPTTEEHEAKAVTKPRYMQWREHVSSSSNLGFRIEGIKKGDKDPSKDYKLTKTKEQVRNAFKYFIDEKLGILEKYIQRLKDIRSSAEKSEFFMSHEVIGSSLLFVHDKTGIASAWMIDFGKTTQLPDNERLTHRDEWVEGNREDGYLFGMDNLIDMFEEIASELNAGSSRHAAESSTLANEISSQTQSAESPVVAPEQDSGHASGGGRDLGAQNRPRITITNASLDEINVSRKPQLRRQIAATSESHDDAPQENGSLASRADESTTQEDVNANAVDASRERDCEKNRVENVLASESSGKT